MFVQIRCGLFSKDKVRVIVKGAVRGDESVRGESKSHRKLGEPPIRLLSGKNILDSILHHVAKRIRLFQIFWQVVSGENVANALVRQDLVETAERSFGQAVGDVPGSKLVLVTVFLRVTNDGVSQVAKLFLCPDVNLSVSARDLNPS